MSTSSQMLTGSGVSRREGPLMASSLQSKEETTPFLFFRRPGSVVLSGFILRTNKLHKPQAWKWGEMLSNHPRGTERPSALCRHSVLTE